MINADEARKIARTSGRIRVYFEEGVKPGYEEKKHRHGYYRSLKYPRYNIKRCCDNWRKIHGMPMLRHKTWWRARRNRLSSQKSKWDVLQPKKYVDCYIEADIGACRHVLTMAYPCVISISKREERKYYATT